MRKANNKYDVWLANGADMPPRTPPRKNGSNNNSSAGSQGGGRGGYNGGGNTGSVNHTSDEIPGWPFMKQPTAKEVQKYREYKSGGNNAGVPPPPPPHKGAGKHGGGQGGGDNKRRKTHTPKGACFKCGKFGHVRENCPELQKS